MSKPWWWTNKDERFIQFLLLFLEVIVSAGIALITSIIIPFVVGWDAPVEGPLLWFMFAWLAGVFVTALSLFVRAHWKSIGGWNRD